jgi:alpha-tubulin suppressor-like RCC1 family protein
MRNLLMRQAAVKLSLGALSVASLFALAASTAACSKEESQEPSRKIDDAPRPPTTVQSRSCPVSVSVGTEHACATLEGGKLACWGLSRSGSFADKSTGAFVPATILEAPSTVSGAALGEAVTCGVSEAGSLFCVGNNREGVLGDPAATEVSNRWLTPTGLAAGVAALSVGPFGACAVSKASGEVLCWGSAESGVTLGQRSGAPTRVALTDPVKSVSAGMMHACALHTNGTVSCWGNNELGALGNGTNAAAPAPVKVSGLSDAVAITVGAGHSCALRRDRTVSCWGNAKAGQTGSLPESGSAEEVDERSTAIPFLAAPASVPGLDKVRAIAAGDDFTCAVRESGEALCWGANTKGQLGDGASGPSIVPSPVYALDKGVRAIAAGGHTACAVTDGCNVLCWGDGSRGQLGDPGVAVSRVPRQVAMP